MSYPYAVVQFPQEGTYSEIPTSWLTKDTTQCRWPTTKNATFFLKKNSPPQEDWLLFDVKVECYCETLEKARKKAEDANYATSCDETKGRGKRIIHEKQFNDIYNTCDDSADDDSDSPPQLCKTAHKKLKEDKNRDSSGKKYACAKPFLSEKQSSCEQIITEKNSSMSNRSLHNKSQTSKVNLLQTDELNNINSVASKSEEINNIQNLDIISTLAPLATAGDIEKVIQIGVETLNYIKSIDKRLKALEKGIINTEETINLFDDILPIDSIQNLKKFEEKMESTEMRANFVEFIKKIGGKSAKNVVQRCMSRLFTNQFGIACSWCGRENNYRIRDLKCIQILKGALRTMSINECDFETIASEWFRLSKLRHDRENKKIFHDNNDAHEMETPPTTM